MSTCGVSPRRNRVWFAAVAVAATLASGHASADQTIYDGITGQEMLTLLAEAGLTGQLEDGIVPFILVPLDGFSYAISFFQCSGDPGRCAEIQFRSNFFNASPEARASITEYEQTKVFGRAYPSEDRAVLEYPMHLAGGVTGDNILSNLALWHTVLVEFDAHLVAASPSPPTGTEGAPAPAVVAVPPATTDEIMERLSGNTVRGTLEDGSDYTEFYQEDGEIRAATYTGSWYADDNLICFDYGEGEACWGASISGDEVVWLQNGRPVGTGTILLGNPNNF